MEKAFTETENVYVVLPSPSYLIISYHFLVSIQPSRPSLLSQSTPLMFWLTITEEYLITFLSSFSHLADPCFQYLSLPMFWLTITEEYRIISYHFFVSVQPSRPALLSLSPSPMFWLTITEEYLIISYHFFVSVQPSYPSLLSLSPSPMFWLTITEEFRQNFGHVADVLDAGVDVVELGRKFQIWNEIKKLRNGTQHSGRTLTSSYHGQGFKPSHSCCFWEEENGKKNISSCRRQWVETNPYNIRIRTSVFIASWYCTNG